MIKNQEEQAAQFQLGELCTPVMKDTEELLFIALAAKRPLNLFTSDTKQAFLNGNMGEEMIYFRPQDWWQDKVQHGYALQLMSAS